MMNKLHTVYNTHAIQIFLKKALHICFLFIVSLINNIMNTFYWSKRILITFVIALTILHVTVQPSSKILKPYTLTPVSHNTILMHNSPLSHKLTPLVSSSRTHYLSSNHNTTQILQKMKNKFNSYLLNNISKSHT